MRPLSAMTRRVIPAAAALVALACLARPLPGRANPVDAFGMSARAIGLAGTYGALTNDFAANYYNPAALATIEDMRLELGYIFVDPTLELNGGDLEVDGVRGLQGGIVLPGEAWGHRLAVSVALYLPDDRLTRLRALPERQPRFVLYDNRPQRLVLTTSLAVELLPDVLYVGAGLTYLSDTKGSLDVTGQVDFEEAAGTNLRSAVDVDFQAVRYPSVSLLVTPTENLRLSLTYRAPFDLNLDLRLDVTGDIVLGGTTDDPVALVEDATLTVRSRNANLFSPRQLALGAAWLGDGWDVAAELVWQQWSEFRSPTARVSIALDASSLPLSIPPTTPPGAPGFHDIVVTHLGGELALVDTAHVGLTLRGGYFYEPTPAPDQRGKTNYVDSDKHGFGLGLGLELRDVSPVFPRPIGLDVAALYVHLPSRTYRKDDPADPVGGYVASGHFAGFATTLHLAF